MGSEEGPQEGVTVQGSGEERPQEGVTVPGKEVETGAETEQLVVPKPPPVRKGSKPQLEPIERTVTPQPEEPEGMGEMEPVPSGDLPALNMAKLDQPVIPQSPQVSARDQTPRDGVPSIELAHRRRLKRMMKPPKLSEEEKKLALIELIDVAPEATEEQKQGLDGLSLNDLRKRAEESRVPKGDRQRAAPLELTCTGKIFRCLKCSCCKIDARFEQDVARYGVGTTMYFKDIKRLGLIFGIMSGLAMPAILTHMLIKGDPVESCPGTLPMCLSYTFLGNVPPPEHEVWTEPFFKSGTLMTPADLFTFYNIMDALYSIVFIGFIGWLARTQLAEIEILDDKAVTAADYTVRVTGLPKVSAGGPEEVIQQTTAFLEELLKTQFDMARKEAPGAILPRDTPMGHKPPEVVEVTLSLAQEELLKALKKRADAQLKLQKALNKSSKQLAKFNRSQTKLLEKAADEGDADAANAVNAAEFEDPAEKLKKQLVENDETIKRCQDELAKDARVVCAFVTFLEPEHADAVAQLYSGARNGFLMPGCCQKKALRFDGRKVGVSIAEEPGDQMWVNHGYGWKELLLRRGLTALFSIAMLAISSALLYYANKAKAVDKVSGPCPIVVCDATVVPYTTTKICMETAHGFSDAVTADADACAAVTGSALDTAAACEAVPTAADSTVKACTYLDTNADLVTQHNVTCAAEYTDADLTIEFRSLGAKPNSCIGAASYCLGLDFPSMNAEKTLCADAISEYFANFAIGFIPVVAVILINTVLKTVLNVLVKIEKHHTVSGELAAMTIKLFCAQFLNTSIIVFAVSSSLINKATAIEGVQGSTTTESSEFDIKWYADVGTGVAMTLVINCFVPKIVILIKEVVGAIKRCGCCAKKKKSQIELDQSFMPQKFEVEVRYAQVLNTVFSVMFFCSGMPILLVIAWLDLLLLFAADKWYFYHIYHKPPQIGADLSKAMVRVLPIAAFLHLVMACWTYSPQWVQSETYELFTGNLNITATGDRAAESAGLATRMLSRVAVAPTLFVLAVFVAREVIKRTPVMLIWLTCKAIFCRKGEKVAPVDEEQMALSAEVDVTSATYIEAVKHIEHFGIDTYELSKHQDYEKAFAEDAPLNTPRSIEEGAVGEEVFTPKTFTTWRIEALAARRLEEWNPAKDFLQSPADLLAEAIAAQKEHRRASKSRVAKRAVWLLDGMTYVAAFDEKKETGGWMDKDGWGFDLTLTLNASADQNPEEASCSGTATWTLQVVPEKHMDAFGNMIGKSETEKLTGTLVGRQITMAGEVEGSPEIIAASEYSIVVKAAPRPLAPDPETGEIPEPEEEDVQVDITDAEWGELSGVTRCHGLNTAVKLSLQSEPPMPPPLEAWQSAKDLAPSVEPAVDNLVAPEPEVSPAVPEATEPEPQASEAQPEPEPEVSPAVPEATEPEPQASEAHPEPDPESKEPEPAPEPEQERVEP